MWRLIFLGLIVWLAIVIVKRYLKGLPPPDGTQPHAHVEEMVKCETCAVHLPRSEAFLVNGRFYCSKAHLPQP